MTLAVWAADEQWEEAIDLSNEIEWQRMNAPHESIPAADGYFILDTAAGNAFSFSVTDKPVLIHAVTETLQSMQAPPNVVRINTWKGFLKNECWEVAGNISSQCSEILSACHRKYINVPDTPGLVAPRVISMIINEAFFALGEKVSTKKEIDIAMKLGTSYPYGPFEWGDTIGLKNIYQLLLTLSITDKRYSPAPLLQKEAHTWP